MTRDTIRVGCGDETGVMNAITELIVTYHGVRVPGDECIRIMREASLWPGTDGSRDLHINSLTKNTEIRVESKTHIRPPGDLGWDGIQPSIETVERNGTRCLVQRGVVLVSRRPEQPVVAGTERTSVSADAEKYVLEAQLHIKGKYVHLGYMYPAFNTESEAAEFHINHYPHLTVLNAKSGWKSDYCPNDRVRYVVRVHNDEALTLNMYNVAAAAEEELERQESC